MSLSRPNSNAAPATGGSWAIAIPVAGILFSLAMFVTGLNQPAFLWLNGLSRYTGAPVWAAITLFGDGLVAFVLILPLVHRRPDVVWQLFVAALIAILVSNGLKQLFTDVHRPPGILDPGMFTVIGPAFSHHSFPSGHTTTAFTLAGVLALRSDNRVIRITLFTAAALVGLSRIVVGIHWPTDVGAGMAVGTGAAWVGITLGRRFPWGASRMGQHILGVLLVIAAVVLLTGYDTGYDDVVWVQRTVAAACLIGGYRVPLELSGRYRTRQFTGHPPA